MNTTEKMLLIQSLDPEASVKVDNRGYHYVSAHIEVGGDGLLASIGTSERSDHIAISRYVTEITSLPRGKFLVTQYKGHRREWQWNGAAFAECTSGDALAQP